jgi:hypothetical protein
MGTSQDNLERILGRLGYSIRSGILPRPTFNEVKRSEFSDEVFRVYKQIGGVREDFPLRLGSWDIEIVGTAIELDESLHFNRYRSLTLQSPLYRYLPHFPLPDYIKYCRRHELECLKAGSYGGKWSNDSCESQFGRASVHRDLDGNGAPRWKQRAFYDFVKDLTPLLLKVNLVRISIWDHVNVNGSSILELISKMSFRRIFEEESPLRTPAEGDSSLRSE